MISILLLALVAAGAGAAEMGPKTTARKIELIQKGMADSQAKVQKVMIYQNSGKTVFELVHCPSESAEDAFLGTAVTVIDRAMGKLPEAGKNALIVSCGLDDFWVVALQGLSKVRALPSPEDKARALREQQQVFTNKERKALAEALAAALGKGGLAAEKVEVVHRTDCVILVIQLCLSEDQEPKLGALTAILETNPTLRGMAFQTAEVNIHCAQEYFYNVELACLGQAKDVSGDAEKLAFLKKRCGLKKMKYK